MTAPKKILEFCLGVGFLIGVPFLVSLLVMVVFSDLPLPTKRYTLLIPVLGYALAVWHRYRSRSLERSTFVMEILCSVVLAPILFLGFLALVWTVGGAD